MTQLIKIVEVKILHLPLKAKWFNMQESGEKLHEIPEEFKVCSEDCQNLDHWCILRFLKHYKIKHLYESK